MENLDEYKICESLKKLYEESEGRVKTNALVYRAYINKVSFDSINEKVTAQINAINTGIYEVNPNFKETSKNYEQIQNLISETIENYKKALIDLSNFYNGKIEQLILRRVELEASLVGALLNEEYLYKKINEKAKQKENDEVKSSVKENVKAILEKIKNKKQDNSPIDTNMLFKAVNAQDVIKEVEVKNSENLINAENSKKENKEAISKIEKEISLINNEIKRLNEQKKKSIYDAMEVGDKSISKIIKKPKVFKKITRFFSYRFNTAKIIETTIIQPLKIRIDNFKNNELSNVIG